MSESEGAGVRKPFYKRGWFFAVAGIAAVAIIGGALTGGQDTTESVSTIEPQETAEASQEPTEPSQADCSAAFAEARIPSIDAYETGPDDQGVGGAHYIAREPIYSSCATIEQLYFGMLFNSEVVGMSADEVRAYPDAGLNTLCYLRTEAPVCDGYVDYEF